jgi:DNA end-binding protein Ku
MNKRTQTVGQGRPSWSGTLRFGLVSFPVSAYNAHIEQAGAVRFHQLHRECHSRIRYEKHCPIHGRVSNDEIVSGYEVEKDQYVEVERDELKELKAAGKPGLTIDSFVDPAKIDPIFFDGRMYLLSPDGDEAEEAYSVFLEGLIQKKRYGLGQALMSGREQLALLRPYQGLLHMAMLNHAAEIRAADKLPKPSRPIKAQAKKVQLAEQLIESWTQKKFDFSGYENEHLKKVNALLEAKLKDEPPVARRTRMRSRKSST